MEHDKSGHDVAAPTDDKPTANEANSEPAKDDDSGVGIGDRDIVSGDEVSAAELKDKLEKDPDV